MPKKHIDKHKQARLAFSPLPSSSPAKASQPEATRDRAAAITIEMSPHRAKKRKLDDYYVPTPFSSSQVQSSQAEKAALNMLSSPSSRSYGRNFMAPSTQPSTRSRRRRAQMTVLDDSDAEDGPHENDDTSSESGKEGAAEDVDDDDELPDVSVALKKASRRHRRKKMSDESDEDVISPEASARKQRAKPIVSLVESDEEEEEVRSSARPRKQAVEEEEDSDDQPVVVSARRRRLVRPVHSEDEEDSPTRKSKSKTRTREDLDDDLEFLNDSDSYASRPAQATKKTAKQTALEALRKKRAKQTAIVISEDEAPLGVPEDESLSEHDASDPQDTIMQAGEDEEDFIVSDSDLSPSHVAVELPLQFSRYAKMKPAELFKYIVEWMIQRKINPAFAMGDDVYRMAFDRLNDFVKGMGGSKFQSSIWQREFTLELLGRPELEESQSSGLISLHGCDACNRTSHPATFEVRFTGPKYDKETLDEESEDEDDNEDDASSSAADSNDDKDSTTAPSAPTSRRPASSRTFYLGKFCMANARNLHTLTHWRYHLNSWVIDYMTNAKYLTPELIVKRDKWSTKKRRKYANKIVDAMEEEGEIRRLHADFRREVSMAQRTTEGRFGGGGGYE